MSGRKTFSATAFDVPPVLVAGVVAYLVTIFAPLASLTTLDLPSALPPVTFSAREVLAAHAGARRAPDAPAASPTLDELFADAARAAASRDGPALARAQRRFAAAVRAATRDEPAARAAVRERHLARFLAAIDAGRAHPLRAVAERHGLLRDAAAARGEPRARALLAAWFALRWEVGAAPELLHGATATLPALLARLDPPDRRAALAWFLEARCDELLGTASPAAVSAGALVRCRELRREFIALAQEQLGRQGYPAEHALAAADVLHARALRSLSARERDPAGRSTLEQAAREAFGLAAERYEGLVERERGSRLLTRYARGARAGFAE